MRLSLMGIARRAVRRLASSCAHLKPVSASHGKQRSLWTPASNHRSRLGAPPPAAQQENAEAHLAEDDWIDDDFTLVASEPVNHLGIGYLLGWLAEDISVDEIFHSVSVDSDSIG